MSTCPCGTCPSYAAHMRTIGVATKALVVGNQADARVTRDLVAYKSMIDQGLEPKCMTGAYELCRDAKSVNEIEGRPDIPEGLLA